MLNVQKFLRAGGTLAGLTALYGIKNVIKDDLVILSYDQIESPKMEQIVRECRGLCLELDTWNIVAIGFERFFNYGEAIEITEKFNWDNYSIREKCDGSLVKIFGWKGELHIQTRSSFADGELVPGKTWREAILECITAPVQEWIKSDEGFTLVCEYVGPYNQVVRIYPEPKLILLTINQTQWPEDPDFTYDEFEEDLVDQLARNIGWERPESFCFVHGTTAAQLKDFIETRSVDDASWEGLVVMDNNGMRMKLKSPKYLALHQMSGNGNIFMAKNLLPFILSGELDELHAYFPATKPFTDELQVKVDEMWAKLQAVWAVSNHITDQKEFALLITKQFNTPFSSILFKMKADGVIADHVELDKRFRNSTHLILKVLE